MNIEEVKTLSLKPDDILVIKVNTGNMSFDASQRYINNVRDRICEIIPEGYKVMVMTQDTDIIRVTKEQLKEIDG